ncbi:MULTISPECIES: hypothetical protein [unclassified Methylobacterium]|jgi:hypothetical protein|uniref:hypothetical protein n=1 Tax=unclassified Methylobacterium TaxID=2615210 RepID=UPI001354BD78|nr:hypothetical protein [Methylobacterium sp. 2A]MWV21009.1 hypothetical protein [Methylobacterium sp. 2A]
MRRAVPLSLISLAAPLLLPAAPVSAMPGMLNARGCHGHPRHCHPRSEWPTNRRGRHTVAGRFFRD